MKEKCRKCTKCGSSPIDDPETVLFRFPKPGTNNVRRSEAWAQYVYPNHPWANTEFQQKLYSEHKMLCHRHFKKTAFMDYPAKKLRRFAYPEVEKEVVTEVVADPSPLMNIPTDLPENIPEPMEVVVISPQNNVGEHIAGPSQPFMDILTDLPENIPEPLEEVVISPQNNVGEHIAGPSQPFMDILTDLPENIPEPLEEVVISPQNNVGEHIAGPSQPLMDIPTDLPENIPEPLEEVVISPQNNVEEYLPGPSPPLMDIPTDLADYSPEPSEEEVIFPQIHNVEEYLAGPPQPVREIIIFPPRNIPGPSEMNLKIPRTTKPSVNISGSSKYKCCQKYIHEIRRLKKRIKYLENKDHLAAITMDDAVNKLMPNVSEEFALLLRGQVRNFKKKNIKSRKWTLNDKITSLRLYKRSPICYRLLRGMFCLPSPSTLKILSRNIKKERRLL